MYWFARAAVTRYLKLGGLNNRNVLLTVQEAIICDQVLERLVPSEASLLAWEMAFIYQCVHIFLFSLCPCAQIFSSIRALVILDEGLCYWPHYNLITSVCTYDHILGDWVLGLHHFSFLRTLFHNILLHNNITTSLVA